jgi:hypothetical protein
MSTVHYRINCGSPEAFTDVEGQTWQADHLAPAPADGQTPALGPGGWCCIGGKGAMREADLPLFPAGLAGLMRNECYGMSAYRFALPVGSYTVRLVLGETHETLSVLQRRFTLTLNGQPLPQAVQPSAVAGGFGRAGLLSVRGVAVTDGQLEIGFSQNANVYGIEVLNSASQEALAAQTAALAPPHPRPELPPASQAVSRPRVLFIGHSGTFFWAIPETVARMVALNQPGLRLDVDAFYAGGKGVRFFLESPEARRKLQSARFDYVVLQDSSWGPFANPDDFATFMPRLIEAVRAVGAGPVLYAYSGRASHTPEQRRELQQRYTDMGLSMGVPVVPCAAALIRALAEDPGQNYHNPDRNHLGMMAGYLFACCWYRALCGTSAREHSEHTTLAGLVEVPEAKARYLAGLADEVCIAHGIGQTPASAILSRHLAGIEQSA